MKTNEITTFSDLQNRVYRKQSGTICHYTSYESLIMILKNRSFRLSRYDMMNDIAEKRLSKCANGDCRYLISFTGTTKENVAMWGLYGKHSSLKLRLHFSRSSLIKSVCNNFYLDPVCKNHIAQYQISSVSEDIQKRGFSLSDVVYYDRRLNKFRLSGNKLSAIEVTPDMISDLAGTIKYDAWEYEKEARLAVVLHDHDFGNHLDNVTHIYAKLTEDFIRGVTVTYSPWTSYEIFEQLRASIDSLAGFHLNHERSSLQGEIGEL